MSLSLKELCALVNVPYDRTLEEKVFSEEDEEDEEEDALCPRNISGQEQATEDVQDQVEHNESEKDDAHCSKNISGQEDAADGQDQMAHNGSELVDAHCSRNISGQEDAADGQDQMAHNGSELVGTTWMVPWTTKLSMQMTGHLTSHPLLGRGTVTPQCYHCTHPA
ncbi:uncharacterized protein LOC125804229 isoform X2 [Astyanax mexicanus]|uniref:Uncharacterized protein n=1 Tax=Astyanax mexicanus TaxID=7994 RepID=A0A8T2LSG6_ASTMX|nr:uncharacterized protein LOC125804229 isoform X2 [Astyanax mexicanus]KAG9274639.1 hypothetical protein AMEX_G11601 [Astyanax mexicanus]